MNSNPASPASPASRGRAHRRHGMAMVEMVLTLPLLMMMLFAVTEFGVVFGRWQTLSNAAREGARTAIVFRADCDVATVEGIVRTKVQTYASTMGIALADSDIDVAGVCGAPDSTSSVAVTLPYMFRVLPGFATSVNPTIDLVGSSVMRNEGSS